MVVAVLLKDLEDEIDEDEDEDDGDEGDDNMPPSEEDIVEVPSWEKELWSGDQARRTNLWFAHHSCMHVSPLLCLPSDCTAIPAISRQYQ